MKKIFLILALLCAIVQGAWAQASWDEVYAMTNTTEANWTALTEGAGAGIGTRGGDGGAAACLVAYLCVHVPHIALPAYGNALDVPHIALPARGNAPRCTPQRTIF